MRVLVTGATGFVGRHVVPALLARNHDVVAVARNCIRAQAMPWYSKVEFVSCDIHDPDVDLVKTLGIPDILVHLAWPGLPNYKGNFHLEVNYPADHRFITKMVLGGVRHVLITGTCLEYGMQTGALSEETLPMPITPYGIAKDELRRGLEDFQTKQPFILQWVRLFYIYGHGQNPNSLLSQLDRAIDNKEETFNMTQGEQLRDYLPVEDVARCLTLLCERPECLGIINCCSGKPISVRSLAEERIGQRGAKTKINFGFYPYPDYEPMEFWGDRRRLDSFLAENVKEGK